MPKLLYFGQIAEKTGKQTEFKEHSLDLLSLVKEINATYALLEDSYKIAVNKKIISLATTLPLNLSDEIAFLPPFSGG
jgi:molybdopterin converting factor small subunit